MSSNRAILNNTIWLACRLAISIGIAFFSTRIVLENLGELDYGVFSVVMGVASMIAVVNNAMSGTTMRYLAVGLGKKEFEVQSTIFKTSVHIHKYLGLAIIVVGFIFFSIGIHNVLKIPPSRNFAANCIFVTLIIQVAFSVLGTPFQAVLNAYEKMNWVAGLSLLQSLLGLLWAFTLPISPIDKLVWYALGTMSSVLIVQWVAYCYVVKEFPECQQPFAKPRNKLRYKEMFAFSFWNLFGALAGITKNQGLAIVLNRFFGPSVNAAFGLASQVSNQLVNFSGTILKGVAPQIMKSGGSQDFERMLILANWSAKYSTILIGLAMLPVYYGLPWLMDIWLGIVPAYAIILTRSLLLLVLVNQFTASYMSIMQARGEIRNYQIVIGSMLIAALPLAALGSYMFNDPLAVMGSAIISASLAGVGRLYFLNKYFHYSPSLWVRNVWFPVIKVFLPLVLLMNAIVYFDFPKIGEVLVMCFCSGCIGGLLFWGFAMDCEERTKWRLLISSVWRKIIHA